MKNTEHTKNEINWLKNNIIPLKTVKAGNGFDDLASLSEIIGDAKIVSLGEATHGTKEIFQIKHRLLEYLATEKGFNIFSIEMTMPEAYKLNDYVLYGKGNPKELLAGSWVLGTEEILDMVLWMRQFNETKKGKLQFTGFDMQGINGAINNLKNFAVKHDNEIISSLNKLAEIDKERAMLLKVIFIANTEKIKEAKTEAEKISITHELHETPEHLYQNILIISNQIHQHISDNKDKYLKTIPTDEYEWLKQNASILVQYSRNLNEPFEKSNEFRDKCMAENIKWILDNNPQSKIVIWAHNGHVDKRPNWMGGFLLKIYGDSMKIFGTMIGQGTCNAYNSEIVLSSENKLETPKSGSAEYYFQRTENPLFILDLKKAKTDNPDSKWLLEDILVRTIGAVCIGEQFYLDNLSNLYDLIIYINDTNSSELLKKDNNLATI